MPAFQAGEYIDAAIRSVISQTMEDWELLVADDGSKDDTAAIASAFGDDRIRLLHGDHSGLPAVARNRALAEARGSLIALLDADDMWRPDKLRRQCELLGARPDAGLSHTNADRIRNGAIEPSPPMSGAVSTWPDFLDLLWDNRIFNSSVVLRRNVLDHYGAFDEDPGLRGTEDYELWLRLAPNTPFVFLDQPLLIYRENTAGISRRAHQMAIGTLLAQERNLNRYPAERRRASPDALGMIGALRCVYGLAGRGRPELVAALRSKPGRLRTWKWLLLSILPPGVLARLRPLKSGPGWPEAP